VLQALNTLATCGSRVLLLGAGGAARAAAFALAEAGAAVLICARRAAQARELATRGWRRSRVRPALRRVRFAAIINADACRLTGASGSPLHAGEMNSNCDGMVYRRLKPAAATGGAARNETVSGVEMFVAQAAAQWEIGLAAMRRCRDAPSRVAALGREESPALMVE